MADFFTIFVSVLSDSASWILMLFCVGASSIASGCMLLFFDESPRCRRPPVTKGQIHLFDEDGEGHFLSAKMPTAGLERLLKDLNKGRFD
jgi:hypothetical protein